MLRILRNKKTAKKVWIGLAIIIIPAFALWGFGGAMRSREETAPVGKILGRTISKLEFDESLAAVKTTSLIQFGDKLPEIEKYLDLPSQAWDRLILLQEAKKRRISTSDKEVITAIQEAPYFQNKSGFSNKIYGETLRYVFRLQARVFEEQMRQSLTLSKLYKQITEAITVNDDEIRQRYLENNEELRISYIASLYSDFAKLINPSEKEIADYFDKNKAIFKLPPDKDQPAKIPELAEVKDKVKEALIKETSGKTAQDKINECAQKVKNQELNQAAGECGLKSGTTDFFKSSGTVEGLGEAKVFWDAAKKLKDNQPSDILSNTQGYYIIKLKSIKPIDEDKFTKEKTEFSQSLLQNKKNETFGKFMAQLKKKAQ